MRELFARLREWIRRDQLDRELREELQFHQQQLERDMSPSDNAHAMRRLGNITAVREAARERWCVPWMDSVQQDVRYAIRGLRRNPGFTTVVVLTLALGLGANAAVFSLLDRLFLQTPSGVADADGLKRVYLTQFYRGEAQIADRYNYPELVDIRSAMPEILSAVYETDSVSFETSSSSRMITATFTDANYWKTLGVSLARGRSFTADEARIEVPGTVAIVSHRFWQRNLNSTGDLTGVNVQLNGKRYDVIGVAPEIFEGLDWGATDIWLTLGAMSIEEFGPGRYWYTIRSTRRLQLVVRPPASVTANALDMRLTQVFRVGSVAAGYELDSIARIETGSIIAARGPLTRGTEQVIATRLAWVSVLVLMIACANIANLLLTRLTERQREIAVRLALGVSRTRLARQFFVELITLTGLSLLTALLVGNWSGSLLRSSLIPGVRWSGSAIDAKNIAGIAGATLLITLMLALVPMVHLRRFGTTNALRNGQRATARNGTLRTALVIGQTALAVVLLSGAMLCVESLRRVMDVRIGYDVPQVAFAIPQLKSERGGVAFQRGAELGQALRETAAQLARAPGVESVALSSHSPMGGFNMTSTRVFGSDSEPKLKGGGPMVRNVSPEYLKTVGMQLTAGRFFNASDVQGAPLVTVVNESMARIAWPGQSAIGQCLTFYNTSVCRTVVGIVQDAHIASVVEDATMQAYLPFDQASKTGGPMRPAALIVRAAPDQMPMALAKTRMLLSTAIPNSELRLQTLEQTVAIGSIIGMIGTVALSRYASSLFYETSIGSPIIPLGIAAVVMCTALLASIIPAWQAGRVSPMTALRSE